MQRQHRLHAPQFRRNPATHQRQQQKETKLKLSMVGSVLEHELRSWGKGDVNWNLVKKDRRRETVVVAGLENEGARMLDLIADFMDDIEVLCAILLHAEAIDVSDQMRRRTAQEERVLGFCV